MRGLAPCCFVKVGLFNVDPAFQSEAAHVPSPDEDTLAVVPLPQAAVTLVGHGKDVRRQLPHLVLAVQVDCSAVIQARYLLVGIYCRQYRTNVGLRELKKHEGERGG